MGATLYFIISKRFFILFVLGISLSLFFTVHLGRRETGVIQYYDIEKKILIDPGHGGMDPGANYGEIMEKDITLAVAQRLEEELREKNIHGILTREGDYLLVEGPPWKDLKARAQIGIEEDVDLLISIHVNNYVSSHCSGGQVFYHPDQEGSRILAQFIQEELYTIQEENTRTIMPGGSLYLLKALPVPAVLIEMGFIKNEADRAFLTSPKGQEEMARVIKNGILRYFLEEIAELSPVETLIKGEPPPYTPYQEALLYFMDGTSGRLKPVVVGLPIQQVLPFDGEAYAELLLSLLLQDPPAEMHLKSLIHKEHVKDIAYQEGVISVTLHERIKKDFPGGSLLEQLMVLSLTETLQRIPQVEQVQVMIEGEKRPTIGGHILLSEIHN